MKNQVNKDQPQSQKLKNHIRNFNKKLSPSEIVKKLQDYDKKNVPKKTKSKIQSS